MTDSELEKLEAQLTQASDKMKTSKFVSLSEYVALYRIVEEASLLIDAVEENIESMDENVKISLSLLGY